MRTMRLQSLHNVVQDLRHGLRAVRRRPVFVAAVLLTLALSVGSSLVVFSLVNALWLRPRPISDPAQLVMIVGNQASGGLEGIYWDQHGLDELRRLPVFEGIAGQVPSTGELANNRMTLQVAGRAVESIAVTANYFSTVGVRIRGRDFSPDDDRPGAEIVAVVSDRLWTELTRGSAATEVAQTISLKSASVRVIGIAPSDFRGARLGEETDIWVSRFAVSRLSNGGGQTDPHLLALARLRRGVSPWQAERAANEAKRLGITVKAVPIQTVYGSPTTGTISTLRQPVIWIASLLAVLVLIGGCVTLTSLLMAHYEQRRPEVAIRLALGSSALRVMGTLSLELFGLVLVGVSGAIWISTAAFSALPALSLPGNIELSRLDMSLDWKVVLFGFLVAVLASAAAALRPMRRALGVPVVAELGSGSSQSPSSTRFRSVLLAVHVACCVVVLVTAALFVRTVSHALSTAPGFDSEHSLFLKARFRIEPGKRFQAVEQRAVVQDTLEVLRTRPGVAAIAIGAAPVNPELSTGGLQKRSFQVDGAARELSVGFLSVGPTYDEIVRLSVVSGRHLVDDDVRPAAGPGERPVLVTRSLSNDLWPMDSPLGKRFSTSSQRSFLVVGVIDDFSVGSLRFNNQKAVLLPTNTEQISTRLTFDLAIRSAMPAELLKADLAAAVNEALGSKVDFTFATGTEILAKDVGRERLAAWFFSAFGLVTFILVVGAVFGLVAYLVQFRRREIGIRLALGAPWTQIMKTILLSGLRPVLIGTAAGVLFSLALSRVLGSFLFGISSVDWLSYLLSGLLMSFGALCSSLMAIWRLRAMSSIEVLRSN